MEIINNILPWLYGVIGLCLVWLIIELILMVRRSRETIKEAKNSLDSAVGDMNRVTNELMPALKKVDPLMDRVSLSVDAINLEILKLDEIVDDVKTMTSTAANASQSINSLTSAPVDFVAEVTDKIRRRFGPKAASNDSVRIGKMKAQNDETAVDKLVEALDEAVDNKKK